MIALNSRDLHLWIIDLHVNTRQEKKYFEFLSTSEKEKALRYKFDKDRIAAVVSRGVLRILSAAYLNGNATALTFDYGEFGKPSLKNHKNFYFNVSHSYKMAVIGFSIDQEIGTDIEYLKNDIEVMDIAENFFSKKEISALGAIPEAEQIKAFYRCWTRKESIIKALGSGLSFPLDSFAVSLDHDYRATLLQTDWELTEKQYWEMFSFHPSQDYIIAAAIRQKETLPTLKYWDHTALLPY